MSQATVSAWENDKSDPPLDFLIEYAQEKGKSLDWLLGVESREPLVHREAHSTYVAEPNAQQLAAELMKRPKLLKAVRRVILVDDKLSETAKSMAEVLGITEEEAYEQLIMMKGAK